MSKKKVMDRKKRVEKTTEKIKEKKVEGFQKLETRDMMPPTKSEIEEVNVTCSLNQFASFLEASNGVQNRIVKGQKYPPEKPLFYYQTSNASISNSIRINDATPLYDGIKKLKAANPTGKQRISNKFASIGAIESFLKMKLPGSFTILEKEKFKFSNNPLNIFGVWVKISPNVVFVTKIKGQSVLGAIKLHSAKTTPFNALRMKVVAFLLRKFLDRIVKENDDLVVLDSYCICIDIFDKTYQTAPSGTDEPNLKLKRAGLEFVKKWGEI